MSICLAGISLICNEVFLRCPPLDANFCAKSFAYTVEHTPTAGPECRLRDREGGGGDGGRVGLRRSGLRRPPVLHTHLGVQAGPTRT